jgi:cytochrome bd-type quinol oxidase subunit 2
MAKDRLIAGCVRLAGILLVLAVIPHATLGMAEVLTAIKTGDIRASMADTSRAIWIFSTMMLLLSGIWALFVAGELRHLKSRAWWQGVILGLAYAGGSIACMAIVGVYAHLVAFALIGLLMLVPLLIGAPRFFRPPAH